MFQEPPDVISQRQAHKLEEKQRLLAQLERDDAIDEALAVKANAASGK